MFEKITFLIAILISFFFIGYSALTSINKIITSTNSNTKKIETILIGG